MAIIITGIIVLKTLPAIIGEQTILVLLYAEDTTEIKNTFVLFFNSGAELFIC